MACVCPSGYLLDGETTQYTYCVANKTCYANGIKYNKEYWYNKTVICVNTNSPNNVEYVNCDQLAGCCA